MRDNTTLIKQLLRLVPKITFEKLAKQHHEGQKLRKMNRWTQFVVLMIGQLSNRSSLRDMIANANAQQSELQQMGCCSVHRSNLSRVNNEQPFSLYEHIFYQMLSACQGLAPKHGFRFKNKLYSMDSSTIDLCLSLYAWADFRSSKAGIKLHTVMNHEGNIPSCVVVTDAKQTDIKVARKLRFNKGDLCVFDRGYVDYQWFANLSHQGVYFVTRLKRNASYVVLERRKINKEDGLTSDQIIKISYGTGKNKQELKLRRVGFYDKPSGRHYYFLTNQFDWSADTIAKIYKARWEVELFFKWIKQHLKIKKFIGTSKNAVLTQIWIALCVYLLLAYLKFKSKISLSLFEMIRLLQIRIFERRSLFELFHSPPLELKPIVTNHTVRKNIKFVGH